MFPFSSFNCLGVVQLIPSVENEKHPLLPTATYFPLEYVMSRQAVFRTVTFVHVSPSVEYAVNPASPTTTNFPLPYTMPYSWVCVPSLMEVF